MKAGAGIVGNTITPGKVCLGLASIPAPVVHRYWAACWLSSDLNRYPAQQWRVSHSIKGLLRLLPSTCRAASGGWALDTVAVATTTTTTLYLNLTLTKFARLLRTSPWLRLAALRPDNQMLLLLHRHLRQVPSSGSPSSQSRSCFRNAHEAHASDNVHVTANGLDGRLQKVPERSLLHCELGRSLLKIGAWNKGRRHSF